MDIRTRHDALVRTLRRRGTTTIEELAGEVGTSRRTVLRDVASLRDQGFVIHSEAGEFVIGARSSSPEPGTPQRAGQARRTRCANRS